MKRCTKCGKEKPLSEFYVHAQTKDGLNHRCQECVSAYEKRWREANRETVLEQKKRYRLNNSEKIKTRNAQYHLLHKEQSKVWSKTSRLRKYNLSDSEYRFLLEKQHGVCAICGKPETAKHFSGTTRELAVDHDHDTGQVRGLLCGRCNVAIGLLGDDVNVLHIAIEYLEKGGG